MKIDNLQLKETTSTKPKASLRQLSDKELKQIIGGGGAFDTDLTVLTSAN